ncbi:MAG: glutaredoxin 3 [Pseudomonadota bacterium]
MSAIKPQVVVYLTYFCSYCTRAKRLLKKKGVDFEGILVDNNQSLRKEMERLSGRTSVPQIFIGEHHIGGYDDMAALDRKGLLDQLLGLD